MLNMMDGFKVFNGTKETYIDSGKVAENIDSIVFITGNGDVTQSCIYAQGIYFANFSEFIATINFLKGISVNGVSYNAASGGGYLSIAPKNSEHLVVDAGTNGVEIGLADSILNRINSVPPMFVGTKAEYEQAQLKGAINTGSLVIILDDEDDSSTIAVLGSAILGQMILGKQ